MSKRKRKQRSNPIQNRLKYTVYHVLMGGGGDGESEQED